MTQRLSLSLQRRYLMGMIHLGPIFGTGNGPSLEEVEAQAVSEAIILAKAGFDAIILENLGDTPYYPDRVPAHTVAGMTRIAMSVKQALREQDVPAPDLGINVLRNDAESALAIAAATDAKFIRVNVHNGIMLTDQGMIQGKAHITCRYRDQYNPNCAIFTDIRVKHASALAERPLVEEAADLWKRSQADGVIVTGNQTGASISIDMLETLHTGLPLCPLIAGSGVAIETFEEILPFISGMIVGSSLKKDGVLSNIIDPERAEAFARRLRVYEAAHN